jgi:heterodisulfide reductase subunit C
MKNEIIPLPRAEAELRAAFWNQVSSFPEGYKIKHCLQCGTCTGTCPVSYAMDISPRQIIALFRAGHIEEILSSRAIWLCASCYSCTVRCPSGIKITDTLYALKRLAMEKEIYPRRFPVHSLSEAFANNVYRYGRNYELGLGIRYLLSTDIVKLFSNIGYGLMMIKRGRLAIIPKKLKRISQIRAIIEKANQFEEA